MREAPPATAGRPAPATPAAGSEPPVRVMLTDDSAVVRGLINRMLSAQPGIEVVASVGSGAQAIRQLERDPAIDVIILDVEMPVMDGLTALRRLLAVRPTVQVIMASTLTQRNAEISLEALAAGAADYVPKPTSARLGSAESFREELIAKIQALGGRGESARDGAGLAARPVTRAASRPRAGEAPGRGGRSAAPFALRAAAAMPPELIAIGCSTGGPQALAALFKDLAPGAFRQPVLITQHMPPTFTAILAEHLGRGSGWPCREAADGAPLVPGHVYVAPGEYHMLVEGGRDVPLLRLSREAPVNFCRPSVDPMLRTAAACFGGRVLAVLLTGMGSDGADGARAVVAAGGTVLAQDEPTSVVWGMPGAVARAGLCAAVLPLGELAPAILRLAAGGAA